ncbi:MAG: ThuA domain-containing protein [Candidatus Poribacteria bacterium]|nr:ThuA domain-containing protein [Candidatus Poribacteria bacterium]
MTNTNTHALVITGGHGFQEEPFWAMFDSFENFSYDAVTFPEAFKYLSVDGAKDYDALVFYDMWQEISAAQQSAYLELLNRGKAIVSLHHALISFPDWDEYKRIVGGVWKSGEGTVKHDVRYTVQIADADHPVTKGLADFEVEDETYGNFRATPDVHVLLKAEHPDSAPVIGWAHQYGNSPIAYIQLGHDGHVYGNPGYRRLVNQAIRWGVDRVKREA